MVEPQISVVIPTYNRSEVIGKAIASVLGQTVQDFEIIVVDDGSNDDTEAVVSRIGDPRIVYTKQANGGGSRARNRGIDEAKGRYIAFLDSDDSFLPAHLETMLPLVEGGGKIVAYSQVIVDRQQGKSYLKPPYAIHPAQEMAEYLCCTRGFVQTSTVVLPADIARNVRFKEGLPFGQDTDFAIRLSLDGCRFVMAPRPSVVWNDGFDPSRVSARRKGAKNIPWIEGLRPLISPRAYHGYRGWHVAKGLSQTSKYEALKLYLTALRHGCYSPKLSFIIFCQIFISDERYRELSDLVLGLIGLRTRSVEVL